MQVVIIKCVPTIIDKRPGLLLPDIRAGNCFNCTTEFIFLFAVLLEASECSSIKFRSDWFNKVSIVILLSDVVKSNITLCQNQMNR
jgi:hypothetical protein